MKYFVLIIMLFPLVLSAKAGKLNIVILDSLSREPLQGANFEVRLSSGNNLMKGVTGNTGTISFNTVIGQQYSISVRAVGYQFKTISFTSNKESQEETSISVLMERSVTSLSEVSVSAEKKIIKREIDRLVYKVLEDQDSKTLSLFDVLRKVPMVAIDGDRNIRVKGSSNFKVFINDKPSSLFARNIADALKNIPASSVLRIEVITSPPVKYDAEGTAGIINIVMLRNTAELYNLKLGARYLSPDGPSANAAFSYAKKKFGFGISSGLNRIENPSTTTALDRTSPGTYFKQTSTDYSRNDFLYGQLNLGYQIDSLTLFSFSASMNGNRGKNLSDQFSTLNTNNILQDYHLYYRSLNAALSYDFNGNLEFRGKTQPESIFTISYSFQSGDDKIDNYTDIITGTVVSPPQYNRSGRKENTFQADFTRPIGKVKLELGAKAILRHNSSNFQSANQNMQTLDDFEYEQNVYSVYNSYQIHTKSTDYKAGFRLERTDVDFNNLSTPIKRAPYYQWIPAISVQHRLSEASSLTASYTKRIERPGIWELNPFVNRLDPRNISYGNPFLEASSTHNFELFYSYSGKVNIDLGTDYAFSEGAIEIVNAFDPVNNVYSSSYQNGSAKRRWGSNLSLSFKPVPTINANLNASVNYNLIEGNSSGTAYRNSGTTYNFYASLAKRFKSGYRVNLNGSYNNGIVLLQGRTSSVFIYSVSASKAMLKNRLTISMGITNPFAKYRYLDSERFTADSYQMMKLQNYARQFSFGLSYKIGKQKEAVKESIKTIINDDLKPH